MEEVTRGSERQTPFHVRSRALNPPLPPCERAPPAPTRFFTYHGRLLVTLYVACASRLWLLPFRLAPQRPTRILERVWGVPLYSFYCVALSPVLEMERAQESRFF